MPELAFDGNVNTVWRSACAGCPIGEAYLTVELQGVSATVNCVRILQTGWDASGASDIGSSSVADLGSGGSGGASDYASTSSDASRALMATVNSRTNRLKLSLKRKSFVPSGVVASSKVQRSRSLTNKRKLQELG